MKGIGRCPHGKTLGEICDECPSGKIARDNIAFASRKGIGKSRHATGGGYVGRPRIFDPTLADDRQSGERRKLPMDDESAAHPWRRLRFDRRNAVNAKCPHEKPVGEICHECLRVYDPRLPDDRSGFDRREYNRKPVGDRQSGERRNSAWLWRIRRDSNWYGRHAHDRRSGPLDRRVAADRRVASDDRRSLAPMAVPEHRPRQDTPLNGSLIRGSERTAAIRERCEQQQSHCTFPKCDGCGFDRIVDREADMARLAGPVSLTRLREFEPSAPQLAAINHIYLQIGTSCRSAEEALALLTYALTEYIQKTARQERFREAVETVIACVRINTGVG